MKLSLDQPRTHSVLKKQIEIATLTPHLLENSWPSFGGLHRKEGQHGCWHVVVVELLSLPHPGHHLGGKLVRRAEDEILALKKCPVWQYLFIF